MCRESSEGHGADALRWLRERAAHTSSLHARAARGAIRVVAAAQPARGESVCARYEKSETLFLTLEDDF